MAVQDAGGVPGILLQPDFISEAEEAEIVAFLESQPWTKLRRRSVQHYGVCFRYGSNDVHGEAPPLPPWCEWLLPRFAVAEHGFDTGPPEQLTVNRYEPGEGIPPHVDGTDGIAEPVVAISLLSPAVMEFTHPDRGLWGEVNVDSPAKPAIPCHAASDKHNIVLPQRSLLVMRGEGRFVWRHSIRCRKIDEIGGETVARGLRISLTFRKLDDA
eukprot:m.27897 g.27897  ORF g.27897 m.27897 type:complete len:213 (+) comp4849_c0_seq1:61-699(+)